MTKRLIRFFYFTSILFLTNGVAALGPHEVLLLVNGNSLRSRQVANHYARLRQIPPQNVVLLDLPDSVLSAYAEIPPADFARLIWEPANKAMQERGIADHILAWAYSADFPTRIDGSPKISVQGITFARNSLPEANVIDKGQYVSPLFAGPDKAGAFQAPAHSFDAFKGALLENMPLPSMMLGLTGARGMDIEGVLKSLSRGALADRTSPKGTVFFVVNPDVRSGCREWQYPAAQQELAARHVAAVITSNMPAGRSGILGVMTGAEWVDAVSVGSFLPGAMADHLTSYSGILDTFIQSKLTDWLEAGATMSAGPVTEPYANWAKFPNARFFSHYASGCTAIESFYQSVRCPLQLLMVGDPLACPWAPKLSMVLVQVDDGTNPDEAVFTTSLFPSSPVPPPAYMYLLDGRVVNQPSSPDIKIRTAALEDGYHELRAVAYLQGGTVRGQVFARAGFTVNRMGHEVRMEGLKEKARVDLCHPLRVTVSAKGSPAKLAVLQGGRVVAQASSGESASLEVDPVNLGPGPALLQAVAVYSNGMRVRGEPVEVDVARLNKAPEVKRVARQVNDKDIVVLSAETTDAEGDPVRLDWFQAIGGEGSEPRCVPGAGAEIEWTLKGLLFKPKSDEFHVATLPEFACSGTTEVFARITISAQIPALKEQKAGFIFDYKDEQNFRYAGIWGHRSAWAIGECAGGVMKYEFTRGWPIKPDREYAVSLRAAEGGLLELWVNEERVLSAQGTLGAGPLGLLAGGAPARFDDLCICPPLPNTATPQGSRLLLNGPGSAAARFLLRAADDHSSRWISVVPDESPETTAP